jgi:hypothetical protein
MFHRSWVICFTTDDRQGGTTEHSASRRRKPEGGGSTRLITGGESGSVGREVRNPQGVEETLRSFLQVRSDRYPEPPGGGGGRRKATVSSIKAEEGRAQAQRSSSNTSEGERSREHRPGRGVTLSYRERTLCRINALKSTPWLTGGCCSLSIGGEVQADGKPRINPLACTGRSPDLVMQRELDGQ